MDPPSRANFRFLTHRSFTSSAAALVVCFDSASAGAADLSLLANSIRSSSQLLSFWIGTFYLALIGLHVTATHTERDWPQIG